MIDVNKVIAFESGEMDSDEMAEWFQDLIDTGGIIHLQGTYQRTALSLCEAGLCHGLQLRGMTLVRVQDLAETHA